MRVGFSIVVADKDGEAESKREFSDVFDIRYISGQPHFLVYSEICGFTMKDSIDCVLSEKAQPENAESEKAQPENAESE